VEILVPINAPGDPAEVFKNEDGSGWMKADHWELWKRYMSGDGSDRDRGRRHKPSWNAWAAGLISQATPEEAETLAAKVLRESKREWKRKHGVGRIIHQFKEHLPIQHYLGTAAMLFIPVVGPTLSGLASSMTPMVIAASKKAIADHEAGNLSDRFRQDYYKAMNAYMEDPEENPLPVDFVSYHAETVVPAAREVRDQIEGGAVETETGVYPLDSNGLRVWESAGEAWSLPRYDGLFGRVIQFRIEFSNDIRRSPGHVAAAMLVGVLTGGALSLALGGS
jgi:hypothetical protein